MRAVDGRGALRVVAAIACNRITIRKAVAEDSGFMHAWRNHPVVRAASGSPAPIPADDHERWLARTLADPQKALLIGAVGSSPAGIVRFDIGERAAEVSIYLDPGQEASGLGHELLAGAEQWLAIHRPDVTDVRAKVLGNNERSRRLFLGAGYILDTSVYEKRIHGIN